jgi:hypothetical protein
MIILQFCASACFGSVHASSLWRQELWETQVHCIHLNHRYIAFIWTKWLGVESWWSVGGCDVEQARIQELCCRSKISPVVVESSSAGAYPKRSIPHLFVFWCLLRCWQLTIVWLSLHRAPTSRSANWVPTPIPVTCRFVDVCSMGFYVFSHHAMIISSNTDTRNLSFCRRVFNGVLLIFPSCHDHNCSALRTFSPSMIISTKNKSASWHMGELFEE